MKRSTSPWTQAIRLTVASLVIGPLCISSAIASPGRSTERLRRNVWNEWRAQYIANDTLPWTTLDSLTAAKTFVWHLPEALEAEADMSFYSGVKGDRSDSGWPLFLYLHGSGPRNLEWATGLRICSLFDDAPALYFIPRIPREDHYRWYPQSKQWAWEHLLRRAFASGDVDPARIYLFGISEGGYGGQRLASFYADYLAGAGPMAGGEPLRNAPPENLSNTAFSLVTGENDYMFFRYGLTEETGKALDSLQTLYPNEYVHRVMLEEGKGHAIDYRVTTPWLKQHVRHAQPRSFRWENYEMDGVKRNAFYNLEVLEEQAAGRTAYDFRVESNHIELKVDTVCYTTTFTDPRWGIEMVFHRELSPASHGSIRIYLSEELINLDRPVTVCVNGKEVAHQRLHVHREAMWKSLDLFGDPLRIFPTYIDVTW